MHIVVTDLLSCPRCGPEFGLVVLADRMDGRQVMEGWLGCANCRDRYPIVAGVPELSLRPTTTDWEPSSATDPEQALRFAALLGIGHGPGTVLVYGAAVDLLAGIAALIPNARVVGAAPGAIPGAVESGLDWVRVGERLPFHSGSLRGVAFATPPDGTLIAEALRVLAPGGHLLVDPAPAGTGERLIESGADLLLDQQGAAVACKPGRG